MTDHARLNFKSALASETMADTAAGPHFADPVDPAAVINSVSRGCASKAPGPSLATGMSRDPANVGGEHEEVARLSTEHRENAGGIETTSLTAVGGNVDDKRSGTAPAASGPERDIFGALKFPSAPSRVLASSDVDAPAAEPQPPMPPAAGAANSNPAVSFLPQQTGADEAPFFFPDDPFGPCRNSTAFAVAANSGIQVSASSSVISANHHQ